MATLLNEFISYFFGQDINDERGQKDPSKYIKNLNFMVYGQIYTNKNQNLTATGVIF